MVFVIRFIKKLYTCSFNKHYLKIVIFIKKDFIRFTRNEYYSDLTYYNVYKFLAELIT